MCFRPSRAEEARKSRATSRRIAGRAMIDVEIKQGTREDAVWYSCGANRDHDAAGLPRTNADKRQAVKTALKARPGESDKQIADHVGVSREMVRQNRPILQPLEDRPWRSTSE